MGRPSAAGEFSSIQNNSDLPQGLKPRLAALWTARTAGIVMPLWSRRSRSRLPAIPGLIGDTEMGHEHVGLAIRAGTGHGRAQPISLARDHGYRDRGNPRTAADEIAEYLERHQYDLSPALRIELERRHVCL